MPGSTSEQQPPRAKDYDDPLSSVGGENTRLAQATAGQLRPAILGADYGWNTIDAEAIPEVNLLLIHHWNRGGLAKMHCSIGNPFHPNGRVQEDKADVDLTELKSCTSTPLPNTWPNCMSIRTDGVDSAEPPAVEHPMTDEQNAPVSRNSRAVRNAALAVGFILPCLLAVPIWADDWPQWQGPNRDGVWRETGVLESFPPGGLKVLWRAPVGWGWSSPVVVEGRGFVTDSQLARPHAKERVLCFEEATGKPLWTCTYGGRNVAWPPPAYANRHVFVRNDKELICASLEKTDDREAE